MGFPPPVLRSIAANPVPYPGAPPNPRPGIPPGHPPQHPGAPGAAPVAPASPVDALKQKAEGIKAQLAQLVAQATELSGDAQIVDGLPPAVEKAIMSTAEAIAQIDKTIGTALEALGGMRDEESALVDGKPAPAKHAAPAAPPTHQAPKPPF